MVGRAQSRGFTGMLKKCRNGIGLLSILAISGCRFIINVDEGGTVTSLSGANCFESSFCTIDVPDGSYYIACFHDGNESSTPSSGYATPDEGDMYPRGTSGGMNCPSLTVSGGEAETGYVLLGGVWGWE